MNKMKDAVIGLAVGDALGVPFEFMKRGSFKCTGMIGNGTHDKQAGTWSDDTSMTLATLDSINKNGTINIEDMTRRYQLWLEKGKYTADGEVFDCGNTVEEALKSGNGLDDEMSNGNGSLMRIIPACIKLYEDERNNLMTYDDSIYWIGRVSGITHNHIISQAGCGLYYSIVREMISNNKLSLMEIINNALDNAHQEYSVKVLQKYSRLMDINSFVKLSEDDINSTGYVIDTLEAAIWSLLTTSSYEECVLKCVNLGGDTDTIAAVAGGLAGLYYGYDSIPSEWKSLLQRREDIEVMCDVNHVVTDIHSHILYGIDDGANNFEVATQMIQIEYEQGVRRLFLTPHSFGIENKEDRDKCNRHFQKLQEYVNEKYLDMELYLGCEIMCSESTINYVIEMLTDRIYPTMNDTRNVLIEFDPHDESLTIDEILKCTDELLKRGWRPIIAHLERYIQRFDQIFIIMKLALELNKRQVPIQINLFSLNQCEDENMKKTARNLIFRRKVTFIGSDSHRLDYRYPEIRTGVEWLYNHISFWEDYKKAYVYLIRLCNQYANAMCWS